MKFRLCTTGSSYFDKDGNSKKYVERLGALGFEFVQEGNGTRYNQYRKCIKDVFIEINSLEELVEFSKEWGEIIISDDGPRIEIYDDYRE